MIMAAPEEAQPFFSRRGGVSRRRFLFHVEDSYFTQFFTQFFFHAEALRVWEEQRKFLEGQEFF